MPEHRGHRCAYHLLAECTRHLVAHGAEFLAVAADRDDFPMAAHFTRAGRPVVRERVNFTAPVRP